MNRGDVYLARFDPVEGSEQAGIRPAAIVSRDSLNTVISTVIVVPLTSLKPGRYLYPTQAFVRGGDGGLSVDSVALCEQVRVLAKHRLLRLLGTLSADAVTSIKTSLSVVLALND